MMITVTPKAKKELKRIAETGRVDSGKYLRLTAPPVWRGEGDFGIVIDEERHGDYVVSVQLKKVLVVDPGLIEQLSSAVLDFKDSPNGPRFTLDVF